MSAFSKNDLDFMRQAVIQSAKARLDAPPNPWVGCVIVSKGRIVGTGFTSPPGGLHAEAIALEAAAEQAQGSTVYVTLEPCAHHGRTPPCVEALIKAKVKRVVIGIEDPDKKVAGKGFTALINAGIQVQTGLLAAEIEKSLASYLFHRVQGRPYCMAKAAISIDGKIAAADHTSQWISSQQARIDAHQLRAESQAILIGTRTATFDQPKLTVRGIERKPIKAPLRVILDASGKIGCDSPLLDRTLAPTLIFTSINCKQTHIDMWKKSGAQVEIVSLTENKLNLNEIVDFLGKQGILQLLVEGGASLISSMLKQNLINRFSFYVGNCILGNEGIPLFNHFPVTTLSDAPRFKLVSTLMLGETVRIDYDSSASLLTNNGSEHS